MKKPLVIAAIFAAFTAPAIADGNYGQKHSAYGSGGQQIIVSCYRGPWKGVIWDRPNPVFLDSLVAIGYDYATARAIGERICRDEDLVDNPSGMRAAMLRIYNERSSYR